ncbi:MULTISPECIES: erythromycin esterase family protein [Myxococcaceae]|uniref:erythromycin esterase family protein n=1 Tax=Myxococcaceae TaxID=31 RepID=UPI001E53E88F|nr:MULTISPECIES: erythromycin esterase family protein [Myxococcaceae]
MLDGLCCAALPYHGDARELGPLLEAIGDARFVLLGEATHGTHEFYRTRAQLTQRLLAERGFDAVAVEADWPDALCLNDYVRGREAPDDSPDEALATFTRFPRWMWRNEEVRELLAWMRAEARHAGFYGLDLYSLHASIRAVVSYLEKHDPAAAARARARYSCFEQYGHDPHEYAEAAGYGLTSSCEQAVVHQLLELQQRVPPHGDPDSHFHAEQNAHLAKNAEAYARAMFAGRHASWNLRDTHMADTLDRLAEHLERRNGHPARIVVWAHNSHLGDARATGMGDEGELNLGQLVRQRHGREAFNLGFTTFSGTVLAAREWDSPGLVRTVRPGLADSYEALFHQAGTHAGMPNFLLRMQDLGEAASGALRERRLERAIGVVYAPATERWSHYFEAELPAQFDAVMHFDESHALRALDADAGRSEDEVPETFPSGL